MSQKYALIIGNSRYDDCAWPNLTTAEQDAQAVAKVLEDNQIGQFNRVKPLFSATVPQMRLAIAKLFDPREHQPDDMLLLYFSGHGELSPQDKLYFVGRETQKRWVQASGLEASYITTLMQSARSRRQVIILDSCYSGSFGKGGHVPTQKIFEGSGHYILTSSEALQRSWEQDDTLAEADTSLFTRFLVQGLETGEADRDDDGWVHISELFDHIKEQMKGVASKQRPELHIPRTDGKLFIARNPNSASKRTQKRLNTWLIKAKQVAKRGDYERAEQLLQQVIQTNPTGLHAQTAQALLKQYQIEHDQAVDYQAIKEIASIDQDIARLMWRTFQAKYPNYDPDALAEQLEPPAKLTLPQKPAPKQFELILPPPFAWVEIPAGQVTLIEKHSNDAYLPKDKPQPFEVAEFAIAKYPVTNAQFALFVKAKGYTQKQWWTEAGWQARLDGWVWDSKARDWKKTGMPWIEPRYWQEKTWNSDTQPVVGVSWYEAVAYCRWLGEQTKQSIMLPTETQWQYAAQGNTDWAYPWGKDWRRSLCNNNVSRKNDAGGRLLALFKNKPQGINKHRPEGHGKRTTSVITYYSIGDSPFGVVDMAGNVWEWCLTEYHSGENDLYKKGAKTLRGGSWKYGRSGYFRVSSRISNNPYGRNDNMGFRLALS